MIFIQYREETFSSDFVVLSAQIHIQYFFGFINQFLCIPDQSAHKGICLPAIIESGQCREKIIQGDLGILLDNISFQDAPAQTQENIRSAEIVAVSGIAHFKCTDIKPEGIFSILFCSLN